MPRNKYNKGTNKILSGTPAAGPMGNCIPHKKIFEEIAIATILSFLNLNDVKGLLIKDTTGKNNLILFFKKI